MANAQKGESLRENNKQLAIKELARIGRNTPYESVQNNVVNSITKLAENDQKSFLSRFCEPIALSVFASFLWENGIKKVAAWIAATLFRASMVTAPVIVHVALATLLS